MLNIRNLPFITFLLVLFSLLSGCSGNQLKDDPDNDSLLGDLVSGSSSSKSKHSKIPEAGPLIRQTSYQQTNKHSRDTFQQRKNGPDTWDRIFRGFRLGNHMNNPRVRAVVNEYARSPKKHTAVANRSAPYLHMIISEVQRRGMPAEIALLPFVESGFKPKAYSRSGAAGLWQFMPATGKDFGLPRSRQFDARLDPFAATGAALNYLQQLNKQFHGDWLLTLAAYNAGQGRVSRIITKFKRDNPGRRVNFWALNLPAETMRYVPKLLAYKEVLLRANQYHISLPYVPNAPNLVQVRVNKPVNLRLAASRAGLPPTLLTELNPYFLRGITTPNSSNRIVLPRRHAARINDAIRSLPPAYASNKKTARQRYASTSRKVRNIKYTVRKGDNLQKIAAMYGVPAKKIISLNKKSSVAVYTGETLRIS